VNIHFQGAYRYGSSVSLLKRKIVVMVPTLGSIWLCVVAEECTASTCSEVALRSSTKPILEWIQL
jgi:hypothetical protein